MRYGSIWRSLEGSCWAGDTARELMFCIQLVQPELRPERTVRACAFIQRCRPCWVTVSLTETGIQGGAVVTPSLTDASSHVAAQATITVSGGAFSSSLPARSLVTFQIQTTNRR